MSERKAAEQLGVTQNTARKALLQLQDKGFIRANCKGSFTQKVRHATTWILTEYKFKDALQTREYQNWKPSHKIQNSDLNFNADSTNF